MATDDHGVMHKNWLMAFFLSLFLGFLGADRFYLGKPGTAILKLLTFGGFGVWSLIDFIMIATKNVHGVVWENADKEAIKKAQIGFAIAIVLTLIIGAVGSSGGNQKSSNSTSTSVASTSTITDSTSAKTATTQGSSASTAAPTEVAESSVPTEYKSALVKATEYANTMYMSKQGVYAQLTSEYGEQFTAAAAQYAIDNVKADWNANALAKAKEYQTQENMSPAAIHDQLVSSYGEQFTQTEADYAIQNLNN